MIIKLISDSKLRYDIFVFDRSDYILERNFKITY